MALDSQRVKQLFLAASELADLQQRQAFLERETAGDTDLLRRLAELLRVHDQPVVADQPLAVVPGFGDQTGAYASGAAKQAEDRVGSIVAGRYKLLQLLGEG